MISSSVKINLIREEQQLEASIAIVLGKLSELEAQLEWLHPNEKNTYHLYKYDRRKRSYLLGRFSSKKALLSLTKINSPNLFWIDQGIFHFPIVRCPGIYNIQVSISHCDNIGLSVAFPEAHPMGVDIEKVDENKMDLISSQLTDKEKHILQQTVKNNAQGYYHIFSIKEALSKVIKTGMMLDFKFLEVDNVIVKQQILEATFTNFGQYKAFSYFKNGYVFSFVLPKKTTISIEKICHLLDTSQPES